MRVFAGRAEYPNSLSYALQTFSRPCTDGQLRGDMPSGIKIADEVPLSDHVTDYDRDHFVIYIRLLDAENSGASDNEMAYEILGIDPVKEPERAKCALSSHLQRARWMTTEGYKDLLK